jgi:hypothetical protein
LIGGFKLKQRCVKGGQNSGFKYPRNMGVSRKKQKNYIITIYSHKKTNISGWLALSNVSG